MPKVTFFRRSSHKPIELAATTDRWLLQLVQRAISGYGPLKPVAESADQALRDAHGNRAQAERALAKQHYLAAAGEGFVTGLGGVVLLPVTMPANVAGFYAVAARHAAALAHLRGYDVQSPSVQTAVALCLVGEDVNSVLSKVGLASSGLSTKLLSGVLPQTMSNALHKAIAFRLIAIVGAKRLATMGRLVPVVGGVVSAGADAYLLRGIVQAADEVFVVQRRD